MRAISSVRQRPEVLVFMLVALGLALVAPFIAPQVARAQTITVSNTNNVGAGSLRQAISDAEPGDTITFTDGLDTILLTGQIVIDKNLTIAGPGADILTILSDGSDRIFEVRGDVEVAISGVTIIGGGNVSQGGGILLDTADLTLSDSVITGNAVVGETDIILGAGIANLVGTLRISNSTISGNSATVDVGIVMGGGIASSGALEITNSTIAGNTLTAISIGLIGGGGIFSEGDAEIVGSTIAGNTLTAPDPGLALGGGIYHLEDMLTLANSTVTGNAIMVDSGEASGGGVTSGGHLEITGSTIADNSVTVSDGASRGGGIYTEEELLITNSTITGNIVTGNHETQVSGGGGLHVAAWADSITITSSTIANNTAGHAAGIDVPGGEVTLEQTIIAGNLGSENCAVEDDALTSLGYNLAGDDSCNLTEATDLPGTDPLLGELADNGGPTWTHAIDTDSPAYNAGGAEPCATSTDQRGVARPQQELCDIGAFELEVPDPEIADLIQDVRDSDIPAFLKPRLLVFLNTADLALERENTPAACHALQLFSTQVSALSPKYVDPVLASQLTDDTRAIRTVLGC